jgi:hypothetical protein
MVPALRTLAGNAARRGRTEERGKSVTTSAQYVRKLCWTLVVLAVIAAVSSLPFLLGYLRPPHDAGDLVETILLDRQSDVDALPFVLVGSLATLGVFIIAALLGLALRAWAAVTPARDMMTMLFALAAAVGVTAELANIAVGAAANPFYCDCGYKTEEVVGLNQALSVGWTIANWLVIGASALASVGVALAGRVVEVSSTWRSLSLLIALLILVGVVIRVAGSLVFIAAFDPFQVSDLIVAATIGILVPIWAILLARGAKPMTSMAGAAG